MIFEARSQGMKGMWWVLGERQLILPDYLGEPGGPGPLRLRERKGEAQATRLLPSRQACSLLLWASIRGTGLCGDLKLRALLSTLEFCKLPGARPS